MLSEFAEYKWEIRNVDFSFLLCISILFNQQLIKRMRKDNFFEYRNFERLLIIIYLSVILNGVAQRDSYSRY